MLLTVKLQPVDDGAFLALPDDILAHLGVAEGDTLLLTIQDDDTAHIQKATTEFEQRQSEE